jgi:2-methylisocitrate lyase-like PEP mutase family enzyme
MRATARLRELLRRPEMVIAPGAYDGITARLVEQSGFPAVYMTGAGTSLARGFPDFGLLGMSEMVENARVLARSISVPLVSDADTGYGNELNVTRSVREFEAAGVAAIHIEDQASPKRCGHLDGKEIIAREPFVSKIRAAVAARRDPDFVVIARTDARAVAGFDEAVDRANAALAAGADIAFVEAPESMEEVAAVPRRVTGPCLLNVLPAGKTPRIGMPEAQALGYRIAILPGLLLGAVILAADEALRTLALQGAPPPIPGGVTVADAFRRFGGDEWNALRRRLAEEEKGSASSS